MNEKITAAWINVFSNLFRRYGCLWRHFQEIPSTSERNRRVLTPTSRNTSTTKRYYTERESEKGKQAYVDTHTKNNVYSPNLDEEKKERIRQKQEILGWWRIFVFVQLVLTNVKRVEACVYLLLCLLWSLTSSMLFFFFPSFLASFYSIDRER